MEKKIQSFWLNVGFLDREMDLSGRKQVLAALADQDVEVRAVFNYLQTASKPNGINKVWLLKMVGRGPLASLWLFCRQQWILFNNMDADVVVLRAFNLHFSLPVWFLRRKLQRRDYPKFILDIRTLPVDMPNNWRGRQRELRFRSSIWIAARYMDGFMMITETMKNRVLSPWERPPKPACVWTTGVDPELFNPSGVTGPPDGLTFDDRFVIMYHGIFSPNRGLQQTLEAIRLLRDRHPELLFFLLGKGPAEQHLGDLVKKLKIENHVIIHPPVALESVPAYINTTNVGILPFPDLDWWDTSSPIKLFEYLSMAKPVIVTDIAAHRSVLGDLPCGLFASGNDPRQLAGAIASAVAAKDHLPQWGQQGRELVLKEFTWNRQAMKIKHFFEHLLTPPAASHTTITKII